MKRQAVVKILDDVWCVFVGVHPDHIGMLYDRYGIFVKNHFFNPKFTLGSWDGKIRFFHKTGKTYLYLLDEIIPFLSSLHYNLKVVDERKSVFVTPPPINESFFGPLVLDDDGNEWKIRQYQIEFVNALLVAGSGIGVAGTGGGKTGIAAAIAKSYEDTAGLKSIIIVPDKYLTRQTSKGYKKFGLDVGEYSGESKDITRQHLVSTWQSLKNNPFLIQQFQVVIVDECHGLRASVISELLNEYGKNIAHRFGVTGTMPDDENDHMSVNASVGKVLYEVPAHYLIENNYLANLHIDIVQHDVNVKDDYQEYLDETKTQPIKQLTYKKFKDEFFPDWTSEKRFLQTERERLNWIASDIIVKRNKEKGNVLCLVNGINVGKKLSGLIPGSHFVHGKDKTAIRENVYNLFQDWDDVVVIATINIASTGLDIPRIFNMYLIDVGKSFTRVIQSIGRGLRIGKGKDSVLVTDVCSDLKYSKRHLATRVKYYKKAKYPYTKHIVDYSKVMT